MKKEKTSKIDTNKSQIKGSRARTKRNLNLNTSLLFSRTYRKLFGSFDLNNHITNSVSTE